MSTDQEFPDDENGHVLREMAKAGIDLSVAREIEFAHRAPDESSAKTLAEAARALGFSVEVYEPDEESLEEGDTDWDVICTREMVPSYENITSVESQLADVAGRHGCHADGWGFME